MGTTTSPIEDLATYATRVGGREPTVVVAGCGHAHTVAGLCDHGVDAYGFDLEVELLEAGAAPRDRLLACDLRDPDLVARLRSAFDLETIDVCYTEQVLSLLSPAEAEQVTTRLRSAPAIERCVHRISTVPPVGAQTGALEATVRSVPEWREACDPAGTDVWLSELDRLPVDSRE